MAKGDFTLRPTLGQPATQQRTQPYGGDGNANFLESAISAGTKELVGADPDKDVRRYRAENPWLGTGSQIVGSLPYFAVPFTRAGIAATRALPLFGRGIRSGESLLSAGRPFLGNAVRDMSSMTAAEVGRLGVTAGIHGPMSEEVGEVASEALLEVAATGAISGTIGHLSKALPSSGRVTNFEKQVQGLDPSYELNAPPQVKMQKMSALTKTVEDDGIKQELYRHIGAMSGEVRRQNIPSGRSAIQTLSEIKDGKNVAGRLTRMMIPKNTKELEVRKLVKGKQAGGFAKDGEVKSIIQRAELPRAFEMHTYLPRYGRVKTKEQARKFQNTLNELGSPITAGGRQMWLAREANEGAYVMVRRVDDKTGRVEAGDEFLTFKTDDPSYFAPEMASFTKKLDQEAMRMEALRRSKPSQGTLTRAVDRMEDSSPSVGILSGEMVSGKGDISRRWLERIIGKERMGELRATFGGTTDVIGKVAREIAAPTISRYGGKNGNARAAAISLFSKAISDRARMEITHILSGTLDKTYKNAIWKDIWKAKPPREGGIYSAIDKLGDEAMPAVSEAVRKNLSIGEMERAGMNPEAIEFMRFLDRVDRGILRDVNRTHKDINWPEFQGMENHYMLSRMWEGKLRIPVRKANGNIVAVASGRTTKQVKAEAERLRDVINESGTFKNGVHFNPQEVRFADEGDDLNQVISIGDRNVDRGREWLREARDPKRFEERQGLAGFKGEAEDLTHRDLRQMLSRQVNDIYKLTAERVTRAKLDTDLQKLKAEDPAFFNMIQKELMARFGQRGNWTKATEDFVDKMLTPLFGTRASEIVRAVNNAVFQLTLGMGNIGFAALNALTFMQTALPEASWLLHAPPSRIRDLYGHSIIKTPNGVGHVRYLEPLRILKRGLQDINKPPDDLWEIYKRAQDEGRVAPVLSEQVFGPNSDVATHMKGFMKGHRTMTEIVQEVSAYLPARTEEMSRSIGLSMGYRIGKDFMGLEGERLYQFAARFVDNTHFRYASADRPLIMRGAFGSLIGLFKSWMMHYIGNTMRYTGDAVRHKNVMPLLWAQAGTMSVGGLSSAPVGTVAEGIHSMASDDPMVQRLYEGMGWEDPEDHVFGSGADAMMYGLPAFLNLSLAHRAAVPGADIPNDIEQLYSIMHWDRAVALGDLVGAGVDSFYATGEHPAQSQETMDAFYRAFFPRTAQAFMQNVGQRGTRSLRTQNTVLSDTTVGETTLSVMGFQPNRIARAYEQMDILFADQAERREAISAFGEMLAQAEQRGDMAAIQNVLMRAQYAGVPIDSVLRSADSRLAKRDEGLLERQFNDAKSVALQRALGGG